MRVSFSAATLTAPPATAWPTNGGNLYNQRYSPLTAINRANVAQLKGVWRTHLRGSGTAPQYSGEGQPIVYDASRTRARAPTMCSRCQSTRVRSSDRTS